MSLYDRVFLSESRSRDRWLPPKIPGSNIRGLYTPKPQDVRDKLNPEEAERRRKSQERARDRARYHDELERKHGRPVSGDGSGAYIVHRD